jgi:hypothetical protein
VRIFTVPPHRKSIFDNGTPYIWNVLCRKGRCGGSDDGLERQKNMMSDDSTTFAEATVAPAARNEGRIQKLPSSAIEQELIFSRKKSGFMG